MRVGRYNINDKPVARGSQGAVHFATHDDGYQVAIKIASEHHLAPGALRWEMEVLDALEVAGVNGVVRCVDRIEVSGRPAMVMPRYPSHLGQWLEAVVHRPGPGSLREILTYAASLARILSRVHAMQLEGRTLVHRDVKPENIFIDPQGQLHLGDFGAALSIDGLRELELALYGTPMWAPLDQVLPGRTIPDPTWDTYAVCVILYAAITGARPAYQADPRELLTAQGRLLWELGQRAIAAQGDHSRTLRLAFADERARAATGDLVALTGTAALNPADRAALEAGLRRLTKLAGMEAVAPLSRGLWSILTRGLSPVSHPSPPNRYRNGADLAEALEDLLSLLGPPRRPTPVPVDHPARINPSGMGALEDEAPAPRRAGGGAWVWGALLLAGTAGAWWYLRAHPQQEPMVLLAEREVGEASVLVGPFYLDRLEVSRDQWAACAEAGACPPLKDATGPLPATGMSAAEAAAYCAWRGHRLPTELEWIRAAGEGTWPWGEDRATCDQAVALGCGEGLQPVGTHPQGATREGIEDLAGNAWEWVQGAKGPVLMGGAVDSPLAELGRRGRWEPPAERPWLAGVRCAR
ncbi:MAG: SUMF1/EgtB/PvdO family nonheme iron enzyme [Deltaproteobacteria bacterium]|nr:SUMF1/EgtB/PvdO family nonheme iron enzyme [Deltaproteobacteria bacterium]